MMQQLPVENRVLKKTLQKAYGHTLASRLLVLIVRQYLQVATHTL